MVSKTKTVVLSSKESLHEQALFVFARVNICKIIRVKSAMKSIVFLGLWVWLCAEVRAQVAPSEAIVAVLKAQVTDWNRGDVRAFMRGYKNSDSTTFVSARGVEQGYENILQRYLRSYPNAAAMGVLRFEGLSVRLLSERHAVVTGQFVLQRRAASGEEEQLSGYFTLVFELTPEGWKIILDHTS